MARTTGTKSVFGSKAGGKRYQGVVSIEGAKCFERVRKSLEKQHEMESVSDGDVMEHAARETAKRLK